MPRLIYKYAASAESPDPFEFVMSTAAVDRHNEIVEQNWDLRHFKKNPIALWGHDHKQPIGTWENVRVEGGKLMGRLKLAARGTSALIDTIWGLVEQGVLRAVSAGFLPNEVDSDKDGRIILRNCELWECSLVSVPANPEALATLRSAPIPAAPGERCWRSARDQLMQLRAPVGASDGQTQRTSKQAKAMTLAEKIQAKQAELTALRDELTEKTGLEDIDDETSLQIEELTAQIEVAQKGLTTLERAEQAMAASQAKRVDGDTGQHQPQATGRAIQLPREKGYVAMATVASLFKGYIQQKNPIDIVSRELRDQADVQAVVKAAVDPAIISDSAWAGNLVRETWGEFLGLLRDRSIYPSIPGARFNFDGSQVVNFPIQGGRGQLAGGFVAEGGAIPVAEGSINSVPMSPKRMKVISVFSRELGLRSIPMIQGVIRDQILGDTAEAIDTALLSATARTTTAPAGLQDTTEVGAANVNAITAGAPPATVSEVIADVKALLSRLYAARMGSGGAWIMNPLQVIALESKQDGATGEYPFRDELASGTFRGYPVIRSTNVTNGIVAFVSNEAMAFGSELAPTFDVSTHASLHMESSPSADIGGAATPVRSLFQTDSIGIRMSLGLDWKVRRQGGVQVLTGATDW